ncbi:unnamed protein product [Sympodiomycopsis kandeliae]
MARCPQVVTTMHRRRPRNKPNEHLPAPDLTRVDQSVLNTDAGDLLVEFHERWMSHGINYVPHAVIPIPRSGPKRYPFRLMMPAHWSQDNLRPYQRLDCKIEDVAKAFNVGIKVPSQPIGDALVLLLFYGARIITARTAAEKESYFEVYTATRRWLKTVNEQKPTTIFASQKGLALSIHTRVPKESNEAPGEKRSVVKQMYLRYPRHCDHDSFRADVQRLAKKVWNGEGGWIQRNYDERWTGVRKFLSEVVHMIDVFQSRNRYQHLSWPSSVSEHARHFVTGQLSSTAAEKAVTIRATKKGTFAPGSITSGVRSQRYGLYCTDSRAKATSSINHKRIRFADRDAAWPNGLYCLGSVATLGRGKHKRFRHKRVRFADRDMGNGALCIAHYVDRSLFGRSPAKRIAQVFNAASDAKDSTITPTQVINTPLPTIKGVRIYPLPERNVEAVDAIQHHILYDTPLEGAAARIAWVKSYLEYCHQVRHSTISEFRFVNAHIDPRAMGAWDLMSAIQSGQPSIDKGTSKKMTTASWYSTAWTTHKSQIRYTI